MVEIGPRPRSFTGDGQSRLVLVGDGPVRAERAVFGSSVDVPDPLALLCRLVAERVEIFSGELRRVDDAVREVPREGIVYDESLRGIARVVHFEDTESSSGFTFYISVIIEDQGLGVTRNDTSEFLNAEGVVFCS